MAIYPAPGEGFRRTLNDQADWETKRFQNCHHGPDNIPIQAEELDHPVPTPFFPHLYT